MQPASVHAGFLPTAPSEGPVTRRPVHAEDRSAARTPLRHSGLPEGKDTLHLFLFPDLWSLVTFPFSLLTDGHGVPAARSAGPRRAV